MNWAIPKRPRSCRAILLSSGTPSTARPDAFAILWITSAIGWRRAVPTTATAAPCGRWARCWAALTHPALQSMAGRLFEQALPAILNDHQPTGLGLRADRHSRISAPLRRRPPGKSGARGIGRATAHVVSSESLGRMVLVRRKSELLQCRAAPRLSDVRSIDTEQHYE